MAAAPCRVLETSKQGTWHSDDNSYPERDAINLAIINKVMSQPAPIFVDRKFNQTRFESSRLFSAPYQRIPMHLKHTLLRELRVHLGEVKYFFSSDTSNVNVILPISH